MFQNSDSLVSEIQRACETDRTQTEHRTQTESPIARRRLSTVGESLEKLRTEWFIEH